MGDRPERIVVLGVMSKTPVGGVVWQTMHYLLGFERLGYEVHYVEAHGAPPKMFMAANDTTDRSDRAAAFIARTLDRFGFRGRWAYEALHHDGQCYGMTKSELRRLCGSATLLVNLHGGTVLAPEHTTADRVVYLETDPTELQIELAGGLRETIDFLAPHDAFFTFGENYGRPGCGLPVSDRFLFRPTRQPVLLDLWDEPGPLPDAPYTTVGNWKQPWRPGVKWEGDHYTWSKHHEFAKILDLPARTGQRFDLALGHLDDEDRLLLTQRGWGVRNALDVSRDHEDYRAFIGGSRAEFTVAKDQNIRLVSGWFSDRSATYLAAGRPVITQDTGFGEVLPTGDGLFPFLTLDDVAAAVEKIESDPTHHARAAREIAREYFAHDVVLGRLLDDLGMDPPSRPSTGRRAALPDALLVTRRSRRPTVLHPATEEGILAAPVPDLPGTPAGPATERSMLASIAVVTHDGLAFTRMCLESVLANTPAGLFEIIVVDNGSADDTRRYLRELAERHPTVRVLLNERNAGFAAATNTALSAADGDVLVLLNNDTIVPPGWLTRLTDHLKDPEVGIVGPVTNEAPNEARVPVAYQTYAELEAFSAQRATTHTAQRFDIPVLTMFCVALRRELYERVGPLDERFELGMFEDDDYSVRVRAADRRVVCAEDAFVHHFGQGSFGHLVPTGEYAALFERNQRRYEDKWGMAWNGHTARPSPQSVRLVEGVRALARGRVPHEATVLVVSRGDDALMELEGRRAWHFPGDESGSYAGHYPEHSGDAITRLEAMRERGAAYLIVPEPSLWWLESYDGFGRHLERSHRMVGRSDAGAVFALEPDVVPRSDGPPVCIVGMHRSGTSMLAQALSRAGLHMGDADDLFPGSPDNLDGYWENARFVALNEELLDRLGGAWDMPPQAGPGWWRSDAVADLRPRAQALADAFAWEPHWGWKDPRTSLTLPFWCDIMPTLRVVICVRNPLEVAASLAHRAMLSSRLSFSLWQAYNTQALAATDPQCRIVTDYEALINDPGSELRRIVDHVGLVASDEDLRAAVSIFDRDRARTRRSEGDLQASGAPHDVLHLYRRLRGQAAARDIDERALAEA